jgi:hypothetical protein
MKKHIYFAEFVEDDWPPPHRLEPYFFTAEGQERFFDGRNDSWGLSAYGADGSERLPLGEGRIDIHLTIVGHRDLGVLLHYRKRGGGWKDSYCSRGDLRLLTRHVETVHGDLVPVGLFVPFATAWLAIKDFIEHDGALPTSIAWIDDKEIPKEAFPSPLER